MQSPRALIQTLSCSASGQYLPDPVGRSPSISRRISLPVLAWLVQSGGSLFIRGKTFQVVPAVGTGALVASGRRSAHSGMPFTLPVPAHGPQGTEQFQLKITERYFLCQLHGCKARAGSERQPWPSLPAIPQAEGCRCQPRSVTSTLLGHQGGRSPSQEQKRSSSR